MDYTFSSEGCYGRMAARGLCKGNKGGTPVILLLFFFVVGIIPIVTGMNTSDIANMGTGCGKLTDLLMVYACFRLPKVFPEEYRKSALYMSPAKLNAALAVVFVVLAATSYVSLSVFITHDCSV